MVAITRALAAILPVISHLSGSSNQANTINVIAEDTNLVHFHRISISDLFSPDQNHTTQQGHSHPSISMAHASHSNVVNSTSMPTLATRQEPEHANPTTLQTLTRDITSITAVYSSTAIISETSSTLDGTVTAMEDLEVQRRKKHAWYAKQLSAAGELEPITSWTTKREKYHVMSHGCSPSYNYRYTYTTSWAVTTMMPTCGGWCWQECNSRFAKDDYFCKKCKAGLVVGADGCPLAVATDTMGVEVTQHWKTWTSGEPGAGFTPLTTSTTSSYKPKKTKSYKWSW